MTIVRGRRPYGSRLLQTPDGPAVLTSAPLGAEEIEFTPPRRRDSSTRRDMETTLRLADQCRAPKRTTTRQTRP